jgi:uncharacterized membrane protein
MALKNPNPVGSDALDGLPDGRYVAVSVRTVGEGASIRPAKVGRAYLEKITSDDGAVALSYANRREETISQTPYEWLKKYNDVFFNLVGAQAGATVTEPFDANTANVDARNGSASVKVPVSPATGSITVTVTVSIK